MCRRQRRSRQDESSAMTCGRVALMYEVITVKSIKYTKKKVRNDLRFQISACTKETPGTCNYGNPGKRQKALSVYQLKELMKKGRQPVALRHRWV